MEGPGSARPPEDDAPAHCRNCDAPLTGGYCGYCGQSTTSLDVPVTDFARDLASETFSLDSRLGLTLLQLFRRPGLVAKEFVAGRRARFVPPIRLYLFASFAMFLTLSLGPGMNIESSVLTDAPAPAPANASGPAASTGEQSAAGPEGQEDDASDGVAGIGTRDSERPRFEVDLGGGDLERSMEERLAEGFGRVTQNPERFTQDLYGRLAQAMFFLLPIFAVLLKLGYFRRLYVHHVVFAIYLHSVAFIVVALVALPEALRLSGLADWFEILLLGIPVYFVLAAKRFYGGGWPATLFKTVLVSLVYAIVCTLTMLGLLTFSIMNA